MRVADYDHQNFYGFPRLFDMLKVTSPTKLLKNQELKPISISLL
jgi:hypothetical protein